MIKRHALIFICFLAASLQLRYVEGEMAKEAEAQSITDHFTETEKAVLEEQAETFPFRAEVSRLMDIIINSLYSHKSVFLRELISNAADALEKARFKALGDANYLRNATDLEIKIEYDTEAKTLTIQDSGVGMTKDDLINNLGTVARSGTINFLEAVAESNDLNLIGQFGVGFYSAFLVADRVTVTSKNNDDPDEHIWESTIGGSFKVAKDPRGNTLGRGTRVTLHLRDDSTEFLEMSTIKEAILKYNQFINFPIMIKTEDSVPETSEEEISIKDLDEENPDEAEEVPAEEKAGEEKTAEEKAGEEKTTGEKTTEKKTDEEKAGEESTEPKVENEVAEKKSFSWTVINNQKPIWMRPKSELTEKDYEEFYSALTHDASPLAYVHFSAEGELEFKSILYIPGRADDKTLYWTAKQDGIHVYARRVLVTDSVFDLVPKWLSFVRGVVDSDDLPLKVDREDLSQSRVFRIIGSKIVGKFFDLAKKLAKEDLKAIEEFKEKAEDSNSTKPVTKFSKLWNNFGKNFKVGCIEDDSNRMKIAGLLRFSTTNTGKGESISFQQYIDRMPENQKEIYFIANDNYDAAMKSPHLPWYKNKGFEVMVLSDPLDEPCVNRLRAFEGKSMVSIEKVDTSPGKDENKKKQKAIQKAFEPLTKAWSRLLKDHVMSVKVSHKLVEDPAVISTSAYANSAYSERVLRAQTFSQTPDSGGSKWSRFLEINPNHPFIKRMLEVAKDDSEDPQLSEMAKSVHDAALFNGGFPIEDPSSLAQQMFKLLQKEAGVSADSPLEEFEVDIEEEAEESDPKDNEEPEDLDMNDTDQPFDPQQIEEMIKNYQKDEL